MGILPPLLPVVLVSVLIASTRANDNSTATTVTFPLPSYCPKSCGNIAIEYPFGVGHGCFRAGFELTCINNATKRPKLFLRNTPAVVEVVDKIDVMAYLSVKTPISFRMDVNHNFSYTSWSSLATSPFFFQGTTNKFFVDGCSAVGSVVDLTSNETLVTCNTTCTDDLNQAHCEVKIDMDLQSFGVVLSRRNDTRTTNRSIVKASIASDDQVLLSWGINDPYSTCKEAENDMKSYACRSQSSFCVDNFDSWSNTSYGYWCVCDNDLIGNPYFPNGCSGM